MIPPRENLAVDMMRTMNYTDSITMRGKELQKIRTRLKWTQVELAEAVGIASNTLARYERDEISIPEPTARLIKTIAADARTAKAK